jgi:HK97 family phage prohead protease
VLLEFEVTDVLEHPDTGAREVHGIGVPYLEDLDRPDVFGRFDVQRFAPGSAQLREGGSPLFYGHDHLTRGLPVGLVYHGEHTDKGFKIKARISDTPKGREVHTLAKDGVLRKFSIGHRSLKNHLEDVDVEDKPTALVHDETDVFEVSLVPMPAYQSADVENVLEHQPSPATRTQQKETDMPDTLEGLDLSHLASAEDVSALSTSVEDLTRQIATLGAGGDGADSLPPIPGDSYGQFLQMVADRDQTALDFLAYAGGTTADLGDYIKDSWVGERFKFVQAQRRALNFFASSPLPADGMGVEYGIDGVDSTQVAEQLAEGDELVRGKITFDTDRAPLKTYGGWGEMTYQQIQRAPANVVERFFNALLRRYAQTTEAAVVTRTIAAGTALAGGVLDLATVDGWTRFVIRSARTLMDLGYPLEGILVGYDVFEDLALLRQSGAADAPYFLDRNSGSINVTGLSGEVFNLPIIPINTGATADVVRAGNKEAIHTYEANGAPFRLQDDDITNLTKAASVYGYMADSTEVPAALIKPAVA